MLTVNACCCAGCQKAGSEKYEKALHNSPVCSSLITPIFPCSLSKYWHILGGILQLKTSVPQADKLDLPTEVTRTQHGLIQDARLPAEKGGMSTHALPWQRWHGHTDPWHGRWGTVPAAAAAAFLSIAASQTAALAQKELYRVLLSVQQVIIPTSNGAQTSDYIDI